MWYFGFVILLCSIIEIECVSQNQVTKLLKLHDEPYHEEPEYKIHNEPYLEKPQYKIRDEPYHEESVYKAHDEPHHVEPEYVDEIKQEADTISQSREMKLYRAIEKAFANAERPIHRAHEKEIKERKHREEPFRKAVNEHVKEKQMQDKRDAYKLDDQYEENEETARNLTDVPYDTDGDPPLEDIKMLKKSKRKIKHYGKVRIVQQNVHTYTMEPEYVDEK